MPDLQSGQTKPSVLATSWCALAQKTDLVEAVHDDLGDRGVILQGFGFQVEGLGFQG